MEGKTPQFAGNIDNQGNYIIYLHCQSLQLWVGSMPKSKWQTSKLEILKGSPSSYVNCRLTYLLQREARTFSTFPTTTVQPMRLCFGVECCQLSTRGMTRLPIGQQHHIAPQWQLIQMLRGEHFLCSGIKFHAAFVNFMEEESYLDIAEIL